MTPGPAPGLAASPAGSEIAPEAMTMRSWAFLKGSMEKVDRQVSQIRMVNSDISSLQDDLNLQEKLWHQAEQKLRQENLQYKQQLSALQIALAGETDVDAEIK